MEPCDLDGLQECCGDHAHRSAECKGHPDRGADVPLRDDGELPVHGGVGSPEPFSFVGLNPVVSLALHDVQWLVSTAFMGTSVAVLVAQTCLFAVPLSRTVATSEDRE